MASQVNWRGLQVEAGARKALARGLVAVADAVAAEAKTIVHVRTGTCKRSIHTTPINYLGAGDFEEAKMHDLQEGGLGARFTGLVERYGAVWVGSWVPYACVLEGRFAFMYPALERVRGARAEALMKQQFHKEGF